MLTKTCPAKVKAAGEQDGLEDGQFEALVSVFGNRDAYGDVVMPGAFKDTLADWAASGDPIPVYWSHRMDDPEMNIGTVLEAKETDEGLWVKAQLDLDDDARKSRQVYRLLKGRRVTQFSFSYDVDEGGWAKHENEDREVYELRKVKLHEVGPTPIGANQETELIAVKHLAEHTTRLAADAKAGRVLSAKNENILREARDQLSAATTQIDDVLKALEPADDDTKNGTTDGKATASPPAKDEEPNPTATAAAGGAAKSEEPSGSSPARVRLLADVELLGVG